MALALMQVPNRIQSFEVLTYLLEYLKSSHLLSMFFKAPPQFHGIGLFLEEQQQ